MPEDIPIYAPLWAQMRDYVLSDRIATTAEIYGEMCKIAGDFGQCIRDNKALILMEVGDDSWDSATYIAHFKRMQNDHHPFISEYSYGGSKRTIGLKDLTVIALAKTLGIPAVSMEVTALPSPTKRRIPDICAAENVLHHTFNEFLRMEGIGS